MFSAIGEQYRLHCAVMLVLYLCQGFVQGTITIMPLLALDWNPSFSPSRQATMLLPVYAFSLKILWAPVVDRVESAFLFHTWNLHRRAQWVALLQILLIIGFAYLACTGDALLQRLGDPLRESSFAVLCATVATMAIASATQDIAVDAWSVEGLPPSLGSLAGSVQLIGLVAGISSSLGFVILEHAHLFTLSHFFTFCSLLCAATLLGVYLLSVKQTRSAIRVPSSDRDDTLLESCGRDAERASPWLLRAQRCDSSGLAHSLRSIARGPTMRERVAINVSRGWPAAVVVLAMTRLISTSTISVSDYSAAGLVHTAMQIVFASLLTSDTLSRYSAAVVLRLTSLADFALSVASWVAVVLILYAAASHGSEPVASRGGSRSGSDLANKQKVRDAAPLFPTNVYFYLLLLPSSFVSAAISSFTFVADVQLNSGVAARFPRDAGTAITALMSISNLGRSFPTSVCLYTADGIQFAASAILPFSFSAPTTNAGVERGATLTKGALVSVAATGILFFPIAAALRWFVLVPAVKSLDACR